MSSSIVSPDRPAVPRWQRALGSGVFLYPLLMHVLIVHDQLAAALVGLAVMSLIAAIPLLQQPSNRTEALPYCFIALVALVGLGGGHAFALYLPPVIFSVMFAIVFARTLRPGTVPLIERFMRLYHHGEDMSAAVIAYARQLTYIWAGLFVAISLTAIVLAMFATLETWSLFANVVNYILIVSLFLGQFVYGALRHRLLRPRQIVPMIMRVAQRAIRSASLGR